MKKLLLSLFLICALIPGAVAQAVNAADSNALVSIYNNNGGAGWTARDGWLVTSPARIPVSEWEGVITVDGWVVAIDLPANNLTGNYPAAALSSLSRLESVDFSANPLLGGSITGTLSDSLSILDLSGCNLSGTIPASLGVLPKLFVALLQDNDFSGALPSFTDTVMSELNASNNRLANPFPTITSPVAYLALSNNLYTGSLPASLNTLAKLSVLNLDGNNFSGSIPAGISNLVAINELDLSRNNLSGSLPTQLTSLGSLRTLRLNNNQLTGTIPAGFGNLFSFENFIVNNNQLSGAVPADLCNVILDTVRLSNNQLDFDGLECLEANNQVNILEYDNQRTLTINQAADELSVDAGGTLAKNTYQWFRNNVELTPAITGDNSRTITQTGTYRVEVTNSDATGLTLLSANLVVTTLPLDWLSFKAEDCSGNVCLEWKTENEKNTATFGLEKSVDGVQFTNFANLAALNTFGQHTYKAIDDAPVYGVNYYRIKQVDLDGRYSYSEIVSVRINASNQVAVVPNPSTGYIRLKGIEKAEKVLLSNIAGQPLQQWNNVRGNQNLDISTLAKGLYLVKVVSGNSEKVFKILKQ